LILDKQAPVETPSESPAENPLYAEYLGRVPEALRPTVEGVFKEWDGAVTQRFQKVHEDYAWAKPLETLKDVPPETLLGALQYAQAVNDDPVRVYEAMGQALRQAGLLEQQAQQPTNNSSQGQGSVLESMTAEDFEDDPRLKALYESWQSDRQKIQQQDEVLRQIASRFSTDDDTRARQEADREVQSELAAAKKKFLSTGLSENLWDEEYVIAVAMNGVPIDKAGDRLVGKVQALRGAVGTKAPATTVMPSGGGVPTSEIDFSKLSEKERIDLVTQMTVNSRES
jgi:hypothetical protein